MAEGTAGAPGGVGAGRPVILGLTGSIGMGKSETARMFAAAGCAMFDADACVHDLYRETAVVGAIADAFPATVVDGEVDRGALAAALADAGAMAVLENIVHPWVQQRLSDFVAAAGVEGVRVVVLDVPLLFETGWDVQCDATVVVSAPAEVQQQRVLSRPGMNAEKLAHILSRQMPDAQKRARADFVVATERGREDARAQVETILRKLEQRGRGAHA